MEEENEKKSLFFPNMCKHHLNGLKNIKDCEHQRPFIAICRSNSLEMSCLKSSLIKYSGSSGFSKIKKLIELKAQNSKKGLVCSM